MSTPAHRIHYTYAEYLSVERMSNVRHEFFDGQIYAMAGGTPEHAARLISVGAQLYTQLRDTEPNPTVLVEVLSRSTEAYDRGDKFAHYKSLPSLRQAVFVGYPEPAIEVWTRGGDVTWSHVVAHEGEIAELAVGARIDVREVYQAGQRRARQ